MAQLQLLKMKVEQLLTMRDGTAAAAAAEDESGAAAVQCTMYIIIHVTQRGYLKSSHPTTISLVPYGQK